MPTLIRFHRAGGPEVLQYDQLSARPLQSGEVRLKVEAIGVNPRGGLVSRRAVCRGSRSALSHRL